MDKNIITTIRFLTQFAVRIYTIYYTFRYNSALYRSKNQNKRTPRPKFSDQYKDHLGIKTLE